MVEILNDTLEIHVTPLEEIKISSNDISIEFDDSNEKRWRVNLSPYQAFKVTTVDCIDTKPFMIEGKRPFYILEDAKSDWIDTLKGTLKKKDETANFMEKAHHYIFPFQDNIVEVVAWQIEIKEI